MRLDELLREEESVAARAVEDAMKAEKVIFALS